MATEQYSYDTSDRRVYDLCAQDMAELLEEKTPRVANQIRQVAIDAFNTAASRGLCNDNPAETTLRRKQKK